MYKSMRAIILLFAAGLVVITTAGLTFFAQNEVSNAIYESEFTHAHELVDSTLLNVATEYQSLIFYKNAAMEWRKEELKNIVDVAENIIRMNYERYLNGSLSEDEAKKISLQQLKAIRFANGVGYVWVNDNLKPIPRMIMHPTIPELDGTILDDPKFNQTKDTHQNLFAAFREVCAKYGNGYVEYLWPKPLADGLSKEQPKLSYVTLFKKWNWIIGSGIYIDDLDRAVAKRFDAILEELRITFAQIKIAKSGYLFLFSGKNEILIHPSYQGADASKLINPSSGKSIVAELSKAAKGTGIFEYPWDKPPNHIGEFIYEKRAYIRYFEPLDWYVCSTVYKDELQQPGQLIRDKIVRFSIAFLAVALAFATLLSSKIVHPLLKLTAAARAIREGGVSAAEIPIGGPAEIKDLGTVISEMLISIKIGLEDKEELLQALRNGNNALSATNYQLEEKIRENVRKEQELLRLRNHQKNILDSMPSVLVGIDRNGAINQWNKEAEKFTERSFEEVKGLLLSEVLPKISIEVERAQGSIMSGKTVHKIRIPRVKDGETYYENITIYPLISNGHDGVVIRLDDVTERVRIEEMMIQTEKMMSVGGLAAGMAHEINNPLGGILQGTQNIERRLSADMQKNIIEAEKLGVTIETIREYIQARDIFKMLTGIREAASRAADIITNMLNFSRKPEVHRTSSKLDKIVDDAISLAAQDYDLNKKYDFKQIEIIRDYEKNLPFVICSPTEIEQVILNLLGNAAQAMEKMNFPEKKACITIRIYQQKDYIVIEVTDNGPGMEESIRKRVFEPFFTTKPKGQGTGLGLSVSYFIITENHHGSFTIDSTLGKGTTFAFKLPINR
ncbi:cache domain-containing protein [Maridesulfovibrio zosterae]|uniref:cache domain-containing protein n=1 Tax=Maridesulfovibrio zosterae TaxID=82171 RepID=UPI000412A469|nr:cache domain-containing protein [Maridesulfovibrio zosterae]